MNNNLRDELIRDVITEYDALPDEKVITVDFVKTVVVDTLKGTNRQVIDDVVTDVAIETTQRLLRRDYFSKVRELHRKVISTKREAHNAHMAVLDAMLKHSQKMRQRDNAEQEYNELISNVKDYELDEYPTE